jgi:DNA sulfur modification protein DndC
VIEPEQIIEGNSQRIALVINLRGGKDSTRMLGYLRSRFPHIPTYCVMADTGFEHVRPVPAAEWSRQPADHFGMELHVVRNPNKTYLERVSCSRQVSSAQFRQCTSDLKRGPSQKFIRQLPHPVLINCHGNACPGVVSACATGAVVAGRSTE